MGRRAFAAGALSALALPSTLALADGERASPLDVRVTTLAGHRVLLAVPRHPKDATSPRPPLRVVVLLHGLAEASDPELAARAWVDRYGLALADTRLRNPPVVATTPLGYFPALDLERINRVLSATPFGGLAYVCPHMPAPVGPSFLAWLGRELVPAIRAALPSAAPNIALCGCSLGGYAALETFARGENPFAVLATTQAATSLADVPRLTGALTKKMYLTTSTQDPYREANEALAASLEKAGRDVTARTFPGPHDQPWLREVGTLDMLAWLDATL